jgi:hypothetical protein
MKSSFFIFCLLEVLLCQNSKVSNGDNSEIKKVNPDLKKLDNESDIDLD